MNKLFLNIGLLLQRVFFAGSLAYLHGFGKLGSIGERQFNVIGIGGTLEFALAAIAEGVLTILIVLGIATRVVVVPVIFTMLVAAFIAHGGDPLPAESARVAVEALPADSAAAFGTPDDNGMVRVGTSSPELAMLYAFGFISILLMGGGKFALDTVINPVMRRWHKSRDKANKTKQKKQAKAANG